MKREFLKELELEDEVIGKIMAEHGKTVNSLKEDSEKVGTLEQQINEQKKQLEERDKQLNDLGEKAKGNAELEQQIEQYKQDIEKTREEYEGKLQQRTFDYELDKALSKEKARNPKAVKALLNTDAIKLDGDKLLGLEEQLNTLKESDSYLFGEETPKGLEGRKPHSSDPNAQHQSVKNPFSKEHFNLTEQGRLLKEDPEKYKQLKAQAK